MANGQDAHGQENQQQPGPLSLDHDDMQHRRQDQHGE